MAGINKEEYFQMGPDELKFRCPMRCVINGPSLSGKSYLIIRLLQNRYQLFDQNFSQIVYVFPDSMEESRADYLRDLKKVDANMIFCEGLQNLDLEELKFGKSHKLIIFDDMMQELADNPMISNLVSRESHHFNISYIITTQNFYFKGKYSLDVRRNASDLILFPDKTDNTALSLIGSKKYSQHPKILNHSMRWLEENVPIKANRYLVIDCNSLSNLPSKMSIRTQIIPESGKSEPQPLFFSWG